MLVTLLLWVLLLLLLIILLVSFAVNGIVVVGVIVDTAVLLWWVSLLIQLYCCGGCHCWYSCIVVVGVIVDTAVLLWWVSLLIQLYCCWCWRYCGCCCCCCWLSLFWRYLQQLPSIQSSPDWHSSFFLPEQSPLGKIPIKTDREICYCFICPNCWQLRPLKWLFEVRSTTFLILLISTRGP